MQSTQREQNYAIFDFNTFNIDVLANQSANLIEMMD